MTGKVFRLSSREEGLLDSDMIRVLRHTLGHDQCEELIEDASFQITERLSRLEIALDCADYDTVHRLAHGLVGLSGQVGLMLVSAVARDLARVARARDATAARAVGGRLLRLGEDSLFSLARHSD